MITSNASLFFIFILIICLLISAQNLKNNDQSKNNTELIEQLYNITYMTSVNSLLKIIIAVIVFVAIIVFCGLAISVALLSMANVSYIGIIYFVALFSVFITTMNFITIYDIIKKALTCDKENAIKIYLQEKNKYNDIFSYCADLINIYLCTMGLLLVFDLMYK